MSCTGGSPGQANGGSPQSLSFGCFQDVANYMPIRPPHDSQVGRYTYSGVVSPSSETSAIQPLGAGGSKDPHTPIRKLQLVLRSHEALDDAPGRYRVLDPHPPHNPVGFSVDDDCARRLLHEGLVRIVRSSQRIKGICPILHKREPVKVVIIRGASVGKPRREGPSWVQGELPDWCWHEVFYACMNSIRTHPFKPWTWDELVDTARSIKQNTKRKGKKVRLLDVEMRRLGLFPPLKKAA